MPFSKQESTQKFVPIKDVRNSTVTLEDGSLRAILMVSTLNVALKSEDERTAILMQFQNFLNTVDFSVQIFMQSRELDIRPYIQILEKQRQQKDNELLKIQIGEYIDFVKEYSDNVSIMTKAFFVVIPYHPPVINQKNRSSLFSSFFGGKKEDEESLKKSFEEHCTQLDQRVSIVEQGLRRTGLRTIRLEDDEVKELFYNLFNPGEDRLNVLK